MGGIPMIIIWLLLIVAAIVGIRWAVNTNRPSGSAGGKDALEILKRRYAAGEIDRDQYLAIKKEIRT